MCVVGACLAGRPGRTAELSLEVNARRAATPPGPVIVTLARLDRAVACSRY